MRHPPAREKSCRNATPLLPDGEGDARKSCPSFLVSCSSNKPQTTADKLVSPTGVGMLIEARAKKIRMQRRKFCSGPSDHFPIEELRVARVWHQCLPSTSSSSYDSDFIAVSFNLGGQTDIVHQLLLVPKVGQHTHYTNQ